MAIKALRDVVIQVQRAVRRWLYYNRPIFRLIQIRRRKLKCITKLQAAGRGAIVRNRLSVLLRSKRVQRLMDQLRKDMLQGETQEVVRVQAVARKLLAAQTLLGLQDERLRNDQTLDAGSGNVDGL